MILQALTAYYEQLLAQGKVEAPGWDSRFKVSYELRLGPDGQLLTLNDLRQEVPKGKKTVISPVSFLSPTGSSAPPASPRTFCATIRPICWAQTKRASPSAPASASRPVPSSTTRCSTAWTPLPPKPSLPFLIAGTPLRHLPTRCWQSSGLT